MCVMRLGSRPVVVPVAIRATTMRLCWPMMVPVAIRQVVVGKMAIMLLVDSHDVGQQRGTFIVRNRRARRPWRSLFIYDQLSSNYGIRATNTVFRRPDTIINQDNQVPLLWERQLHPAALVVGLFYRVDDFLNSSGVVEIALVLHAIGKDFGREMGS